MENVLGAVAALQAGDGDLRRDKAGAGFFPGDLGFEIQTDAAGAESGS